MAERPGLKRRRRALLSVTDKTDLEHVAAVLDSYDYEFLASGGTAAYLREHGHEVRDVGDLTGFPEIFGGRVKTLHPLVFGGILGPTEEDFAAVAELDLAPIDVVVCNRYAFGETVAARADEAACVEKIDIGGPSLLRAAAKNFPRVCVLCDPEDYDEFVFECRAHDGLPGPEFRRRMAVRAFALVTEYDTQISDWFGGEEPVSVIPLRYGENPHQEAELYAPGADPEDPLVGMGLRQLNGKQLSYNNLVDVVAGLKLAADLGGTSCAVLKHTNPCGAATAGNAREALDLALRCDPESAFGGIFVFTGEVDAASAEILAGRFCEVVLAPAYADDARERLCRKKNLRVLTYDAAAFADATRGQSRSFGQVTLWQEEDAGFPELDDWRHAAGPEPDAALKAELAFAWKVCKHVKSNAIVLTAGGATLGIGAGQMSRVDSARIAVRKAGDQELDIAGSVCASDAFFPFPDSVERLHEAGVAAIIAPAGSIRDDEVVAAANRLGVTLMHTSRRHFRH